MCSVGIDRSTLESMCELYQFKPETLLVEETRAFAQCCMQPYVNETYAFCGQTVEFAGFDLTVNVFFSYILLHARKRNAVPWQLRNHLLVNASEPYHEWGLIILRVSGCLNHQIFALFQFSTER